MRVEGKARRRASTLAWCQRHPYVTLVVIGVVSGGFDSKRHRDLGWESLFSREEKKEKRELGAVAGRVCGGDRRTGGVLGCR